MRTLITGGAGFIGSHVADACLEAGHEVTIVDDLSSGSRSNLPAGARFVELDIRDAAALDAVLAEVRPQAISHQAAQVSVSISTREPQRDAAINVLGTINLLESAAKHRVERFVFASTGGAIYGELPEPLSPYACSKLAVEGYLAYYRHAHGVGGTILRYANVYGPRQDPHGEAGVVAIFTKRLIAGEAIQINARREPGDDGCIRDYVFVGDVVRANRMAIAGEIDEEIVNIGTGVETTTRALAQRIESSLGVKAKTAPGPRRAGDVERSVLEPWNGLGKTVALADGIAKTVEWFRSR
jgi:UDP-glucose 4-epimerase